jgi:peptidoglycan hydrolase CwlO-like protein
LQELKMKELAELDAIFSELGISTEEKAAREAAAEKKKKKKEKKKANGEAENGSSSAEQQQQQQQQPAAAPEPEPEPAVSEESGDSLDPAVVSDAAWSHIYLQPV